MQPSQTSVEGVRDNVGRVLGTIAAILWIAMGIAAFWNQQYVNVNAPTEGFVLVLGAVLMVLMSVLVPFAIGAYVAWRRRAHAHPVFAAAGAAVLVQWATLALGVIVALVADTQRTISYLSVEANVTMEIPLVLIVFGSDAAIMGAAGGFVTVLVSRRVARRHAAEATLPA